MSEKTPTPIPSDGEPEHKGQKVVQKMKELRGFGRWLRIIREYFFPGMVNSQPRDSMVSWWALVMGAMVAIIYALQYGAMLSSNQLVQQSFEATQRPIVSIGRKDGTLAEFAVPSPKATDQNVGLKIYVQNGGPAPALTPNLGLLLPTLLLSGSPKPTYMPPSKNEFHPLLRSTDGKGNYSFTGGGSIAPGSEYVFFFPDQVTQEQYDAMIKGEALVQIEGRCEYCDSFGRYTCRDFTLVWRGPPFNAFFKPSESDCAFLYGYPEKAPPNHKFLLPCEQPDEREARQEQERMELLKEAGLAPSIVPQITEELETAIAP